MAFMRCSAMDHDRPFESLVDLRETFDESPYGIVIIVRMMQNISHMNKRHKTNFLKVYVGVLAGSDP